MSDSSPDSSAPPASATALPASSTTLTSTGTETTIKSSANSSSVSRASTTSIAAASGTAAQMPDAAAMLQAALAGLGTAYHFSGTVTVNGVAALSVEGDHVGDGSRMEVVSNGASVSYVVLPDATWVRESGGEWEVLQDPPASVDPIDALSEPTTVSVPVSDGQTAQFDATVPSTSLGMPGDAVVPVHIVLTGGALTKVSYATIVSNVSAQVDTTFGPPADGSAVVAPA